MGVGGRWGVGGDEWVGPVLGGLVPRWESTLGGGAGRWAPPGGGVRKGMGVIRKDSQEEGMWWLLPRARPGWKS